MTTVTRRPDTATDDPHDVPFTAAVDSGPDDPTADTAGLGRRPAHGRVLRAPVLARSRLLWGLASLLVLAAVAAGATVGRTAWLAHRASDARSAALAAGRQIAVDFVTMRAASFDTDTRRVLDAATGTFRTEYAAALKQLKPVVTANRSVSTVERAEAAVVSADDDSARVIVGIVAPTSNTATPKPENKTYRLRLDLVRVGDAWKVSTLDFVG